MVPTKKGKMKRQIWYVLREFGGCRPAGRVLLIVTGLAFVSDILDEA
jgi:hypothetical protein